MLPKNRRIQRKEFSHIFSAGKRYNSPIFLLYSVKQPANSVQKSRFSFSVSKKVFKLAVDRNKQRRRGYFVIQRNLSKMKDGYDCFFSFKNMNKKTKIDVLEKEILELLSNAGVLV